MNQPRALGELPAAAPTPRPAGYRYPFSPYPTGWYRVASMAELKAGAVLTKLFAGREIVLHRTSSGVARASEAHCPHLGAHFGHGGEVRGEELWCPFHGFCFDGDGTCTKTGYDTPPPKTARLAMIPIVEMHEQIFAWHDDAGAEPRFALPQVDGDGWSRWKMHSFRLPGHPQETSENSVDLGHLMVVHGYSGLETMEKLRMDGDYLTVRYAMHRKADFFGQADRTIRSEFTIHVHGLGYSRVEVEVPEFGVRSRHLVLSTPLDGNEIDLTIGVSLADVQAKSVHPLLGLLPNALVRELALRGVFFAYKHDVSQDLAIWTHKKYIHPPQVARGDGPIGRYRTWVRRFYVDGS